MLFRRPVHEVAGWPAREVDLIETFIAREPPPDARMEIAIARLCELFVKAWSSDKRQVSLMEFLPFLKAWNAPELDRLINDARYSDVDREVLKVLK